jgi:uncharacterized membrane protein YraQ (UPF0718 family)/regulator of protease activity HflC (stomatin/prohibitin superfamily)
MTTAGNVAEALWTLVASSSGYLLLGLFAAGAVHTIARRFDSLHRAIPRGWRAIGYGIVAGLPLPVCSCGIAPIALALRRRHAHPETVAAFVVSTPETSLDAVGLTAALFGLPFALLRVLAGLTAAFLAGLFAIATEAWPGAEHHEYEPHEHDLAPSAPPEWWPRLVAWTVRMGREWFGRAPLPDAPPAAEEPPSKRARLRRTLVETMRLGFVETLDEISWMLLIGFVVSALLMAFLPNDFAARIPGGLAGQTLFGLAISLPLYVCASGSIPLAAALMAKGLSPVAVLAIFLIGPITNPAMVLLLGRSFGKRFVVGLIVAGLIAAIVFGAILTSVTPSVSGAPSTPPGPSLTLGVTEVFFTILFLPIFILSLARTGWRRGAHDLRLVFEGIVPAEVRVSFRSGARRLASRRRQLASAVVALLAIAWLLGGCAVIPEGAAGFEEVFGRAGRQPLGAGLHWTFPRPIGRMRVIDSGSIVNVSVGFRPEAAPERGWGGLVFSSADSGWHSIYTSAGPRPEESTYVTGDLNLVESKANIHLRVSDPRAFAYQGGDPIESVRSLFQASLRELLASRSIDDTLTMARASIEEAAGRDLQRRLAAAHVPLQVLAVNLLDLHPPDASVRAFRDISSALEDRETRIHQARGKADAALPSARGEAAVLIAAADSDRKENVARAGGVATAFAVQADVAKRSGAAVRSMLRWNALDRLFAGKRIVLYPHSTPRDLIETPPAGGFF